MNKLMKKYIWTFLVLMSVSTLSYGQISYGFRSGVGFSKFLQENEQDDQGNPLDEDVFSSGFHLGVAFGYRLSDVMMIRAEILYNQKGGRYRYDGPSYMIFSPESGADPIPTVGNRKTSINISNAYLNFPLSVAFKLGDSFEVFGGIGFGVLLNSLGAGQRIYSDGVSIGLGEVVNNGEEIAQEMDYDYFNDNDGQASVSDPYVFLLSGELIQVPREIGAYYDTSKGETPFYSRIDVDLNAGISYYLSSNLFLSTRVFYGLTDVVDDSYQFRRYSLDDNNERIPFGRTDRNLSIQVSLGFFFGS